MNVRPATVADIPAIVAMAQRFYDATTYPAIGPMAKESSAGLAILCMRDGVMLVADEDGELAAMACLHVSPYLFNPSISVAEEVAFWIEPEHRGGTLAMRLLNGIEDACVARGVDVIRMATLENSPPAAAALYEKRGFVRSDSHYMRAASW